MSSLIDGLFRREDNNMLQTVFFETLPHEWMRLVDRCLLPRCTTRPCHYFDAIESMPSHQPSPMRQSSGRAIVVLKTSSHQHCFGPLRRTVFGHYPVGPKQWHCVMSKLHSLWVRTRACVTAIA